MLAFRAALAALTLILAVPLAAAETTVIADGGQCDGTVDTMCYPGNDPRRCVVYVGGGSLAEACLLKVN